MYLWLPAGVDGDHRLLALHRRKRPRPRRARGPGLPWPVSCSVMSCPVMSYHVIHTMSYDAMPCHVMSCHAVLLFSSLATARIVHRSVFFFTVPRTASRSPARQSRLYPPHPPLPRQLILFRPRLTDRTAQVRWMLGRVLRVLVPLPRLQARHLPRQEQGDHPQGQEVQGPHLLRLILCLSQPGEKKS